MTDAERTEVRQIVREEIGRSLGISRESIESWKQDSDDAVRAWGFAQMRLMMTRTVDGLGKLRRDMNALKGAGPKAIA